MYGMLAGVSMQNWKFYAPFTGLLFLHLLGLSERRAPHISFDRRVWKKC